MELRKIKSVNDINRMVYTKGLDDKFRYDGKDLGAHCSEGGSIFKVWSPFANNVELHLYQDGETDIYRKHELIPDVNGTWKLEFPENLH